MNLSAVRKSGNLLFVLLIAGCAQKFLVRQDQAGIPRVGIEGSELVVLQDEVAVRDASGKLFFDVKEATQKLNAKVDTIKAQLPECGSGMVKAVRWQKQAIDHISEGLYDFATEELQNAEKSCAQVGWQTPQFYYQAIIFEKKNQPVQARESAQNFLDFAGSSQPNLSLYRNQFYFNSRADSEAYLQELKFYREKASEFLKNPSTDLSLSTRAKTVSPLRLGPNRSNDPGGNETGENKIRLGMNGPVYIGYKMAWEKYSISAGTALGIGALSEGEIRRSLYESPSREFNWDLSTKVFQYRFYDSVNYYPVQFDATQFRRDQDYSNVATGTAYRLATGFTKRWLDCSWRLAGTFGVDSFDLNKTTAIVSELFLTRDLFIFSPFVGEIRNDFVYGADLLWLRMVFNPAKNSFYTQLKPIEF